MSFSVPANLHFCAPSDLLASISVTPLTLQLSTCAPTDSGQNDSPPSFQLVPLLTLESLPLLSSFIHVYALLPISPSVPLIS